MDWHTIFNEYRPKIYRYLVRLVGPLEAEDLTQEVFLKVNQGLAGFRSEAKVSTWLYRIATNAAVDLHRRKKSRPSLAMAIQEEADDPLAIELPDDARKGGCPQHEIELQEMNACIRRLLDRLPEQTGPSCC
jgi:RNA polymerase sigma-70 factor (ECF subfamily)